MSTNTDRVLRSFMTEADRLHTIPTKHAKLLVVLDRLAQEFEPGTTYPEKDVNAVLERFHPDYAALRRYLVENQFLTREDGVYWAQRRHLRCLRRRGASSAARTGTPTVWSSCTPPTSTRPDEGHR